MEWEDIRCAMAVVAHPDDIEFGMAGTTARLTAEGKRVVYVITTDGSKGSSQREMTPEHLSEIRKREQREAARQAGVTEVCFLDFPDGMLEPTLHLRRAIAGAIRRFQPDVVLCQNPTRDLAMRVFAQHPDHLATGEATFAAIYPTARDHMTFPELLEEGLEPWKVSEIWVSGVGNPDFYVDITSTLEAKLAALKAHESQVDAERIDTMIPERARGVAKEQDFEFAESFTRIRLT